MSDSAELKTPLFLLAMPQVQDPYFQKSVILLLQHEEAGSFGFIINRPFAGVKIAEVLDESGLPKLGDNDSLVFFGGPVQLEVGTLLYRTDPQPDDDSPTSSVMPNTVCPGVVWTQHTGDLELLAEEPPTSFRLLLGCAGWGEGQLVAEILRNDWLTAPINDQLIFSDEPDEVWRSALRSVGVDPAQLLSWNGSGDTAPIN